MARQRIANGIELGRQSWAALRQNPQLLAFPIISLIATIAVSIIFFIPIAGSNILDSVGGRGGDDPSLLTIILVFLYYFVNYSVVIFSNTALIASVMKLLRGETATVQDGLNVALARLPKILVYAFISATVGMIARSIAQSGRSSNNLLVAIIAGIIGGLLQGAWNIVVFFAIPVLVVENVGVVDSLKRSFEIFKSAWGEGFVGSTVIGGISCLIYLAVFVIGGVIVAAAVASQSVVLIIAAVALVVIALVALGLVSGAVNGIFQASLYMYATTGDAGKYIDTNLAREAFLAR